MRQIWGLLLITLFCLAGVIGEAIAEPDTASAYLQKRREDKLAKEQLSGATSEEISKAYMNCLMDLDLMVADLVANDKQQARSSEAKAQLAFCENRKRDCKSAPKSPECRVFIEEFVTEHK
jgi:hypothetical protein